MTQETHLEKWEDSPEKTDLAQTRRPVHAIGGMTHSGPYTGKAFEDPDYTVRDDLRDVDCYFQQEADRITVCS